MGPDKLGTFLSVDSSGMRLVRTTQGSILYMPNGGKYHFPAARQHTSESTFLYYATKFEDVSGNKTVYSEEERDHRTFVKQTDTMERTITDPLPQNFGVDFQMPRSETIAFPGLGSSDQEYEMHWKPLKPVGCEESANPSCGDGDGALEDQSQKLYFETGQYCSANVTTSLLANPNNPDDPANEVLFPRREDGLRPCNASSVTGGVLTPHRSNPVVLSGINLPNGKSYVFKYNRYGEISRIIYPAGGSETFVYGKIKPLSMTWKNSYDQTNRGVIERRVYDSSNVLQERWRYSGDPNPSYSSSYTVTTMAPKGNDALGDGMKTERILYAGSSAGANFGLESPLTGRTMEEKTYDENGVLRSRTINDWIVKRPPIGGTELVLAHRDLRLKRSATILFDPASDAALATMNETDYDETGSTDPTYFSHLNAVRSKRYHYVVIPNKTTVDHEMLFWEDIEDWFPPSKLASVSETDYSYNSTSAAYKDRGIIGLPVETRVLNPANTADVLAKSQPVYDEGGDYFIDEGSTIGYEAPSGTNTHLRGNVTTSRTWVKETDTWLEIHAQYDNFGNVRKVWDASGDSSKFVETEYSSTYNYAYPTKVISPAPAASSNNHVTNETSSVETTYDPNTGLVLTVKDDFGQIIATEYNDPLLRPTKVFGSNFTAPIAETIYDDNALTVKVRKQIDETNWDEATTFADSLGRTIKTIAKDSQGDVIVESHYDFLGRVDRVTNPYRSGETVYWSKTRYDEAGRAVESYAPETLANLANAQSLGTTAFSFSAVTNYVGTVVTTKDASERRGRSITNALGQLLRVDEPTAIGGSNDLGDIAAPNQPTAYTYDPYGNMVKVTQGAQNRYFKYDSLGRLIRVRQPEQETNPNIGLADTWNTSGQWTASFTYDDLGNVLTATDAKHVTIANTYDRAGRVLVRSYYGETGVTTPPVYFFYDGKGLSSQQSPNYAKGKLTLVSNDVSETRYKLFDNFGRLKEMEQRTPLDGETTATATPRVSKYTYNLSGALVEEEYPSGRKIKNEFESDGDLSRVYGKANSGAPEQTYANSFKYTAASGVSQMRLGNGRWETAQFNNRLQVTQIGLGNSATDGSLWKTDYHYGELNTDGSVNTAKNTGKIAKQTLTLPGATFNQGYQYDALYRLTSAKEWTGTVFNNPNWTQAFGYDLYGNRTSFNQNIGGVQTNTTPAINAATNRFSSGYTYDKNGNIIADVDPANSQARSFVFNGDNKQVEVKNASNVAIGKYYYDGEGKRVKKVTDTETTIFVYSGGKLAEEYSTQVSNNPTIAYTTTDHLGSPRIITDKFGQVKSRRDFMPFGEDIFIGVGGRTGDTGQKYASSQDDVRQKFTGYEKDSETSLDFAEARMYENRHGRFTAVDPLMASGNAADPQTFNRYVYVGNCPLIITDPTGEIWTQRKTKFNGKEVWAYTWYNTYDDYKTAYDQDNSIQITTQFLFENANGAGWISLDKFSRNAEELTGLQVFSGMASAMGCLTCLRMAGYTQYSGIESLGLSAFLKLESDIYTAIGNTLGSKPVQNFLNDPGTQGILFGSGVLAVESNIIKGFQASRAAAVTNDALATNMVKNADKMGELYTLRAGKDGYYPVMQRGSQTPVGEVFLKKGNVWKYGETINPSSRYTQKFLKQNNLRYFTEATGPKHEMFQLQNLEIVNFRKTYGFLPPGNKGVQ
jgi:RHS repeat-associated protein